jgi:hypothetical protein
MAVDHASRPAAAPVLHTDWPLIDIGAADADRVCALFAEVFGTQMSHALWHWKYGDGRGTGVGLVHPDGRLIAHYGVALREIEWAGGVVRAVHAGDVMVAPRARHVFSRHGPFGRLTEGIIDKCFGPNGFAEFGFGFPNARHIRLGSKLGFYWCLEHVWELHWRAPPAAAPGLASTAQPWGPQATYDRLHGVFARATPADPAGLRPRRDADVWRHRFANHPHIPYQLHLVHRTGEEQAVGAFVLKPPTAPDAPWELMDWTAAHEAADAMIALAAEAAFAQGAAGMLLWASTAVVDALPQAMLNGATRQQACEVASAQAQVLGRPAESWQGKVWLTGADTDFR